MEYRALLMAEAVGLASSLLALIGAAYKVSKSLRRLTMLILIYANYFLKSPSPNFRLGPWSMPGSLGRL